MFRRRPKSKQSFLFLSSSNRGSDIKKPDNTSLIVNDSDSDSDALPKELTSVLSEDEDEIEDADRKTTSLMKSLTQKTQSTPKKPLSNHNGNRIEKKKGSFFDEVLRSCGASALTGDSSYLMSVDQAVFSIKLNKKLKENEENFKEFISAFEKEVDRPESLQKMLAHTLTAEDCSAARGPIQEPLMRMLLNVDCLQAKVIDVLLQKLASIILDGNNEDLQIVSSILRQMRFLNKVSDVKISSQLFEIIQVSPLNVQREIIFFLPEVISEKETEETSTQLIELLKSDVKLTQVIIDALTNLPLENEVRKRVRAKILIRMDKSALEHLPSLVQFALNRCDEEILNEVINDLKKVINGIRENLPFTLQHLQIRKSSSKKHSDEDSYTKLTFENLKFSVMASKSLAAAWIKIISNINSSFEFRCIDIVTLIIFYSCLFGRKSEIRTLLRNKVKSGILNHAHVQNMFKIVPVIAAEYFPTILELASTLLKSIEEKVAEFGALLYKECFINFNPYMKQTVISEILLHIGTGSPAVINAALTIIKELLESHKEALYQHTMTIMRLLIKIPDLDLSQVRLLMDIIAGLVFSEFASYSSGQQDELQIFIRKQLVSSKPEQAKKGIVAAIILAKHAGKRNEDGELKYSHINSLLEMAVGSNGTSDTKRAFFNDEFATMLKESKLNSLFLEPWYEKIFRSIMDNLIVENIDVECSDFPMYLQYSLERSGEPKLVFPVVAFVLDSHSNKPLNIPIPVIPSTLRLLWCLEENFCKILPIFNASVIMPESIVYDSFNTYDDDQKKKILDCLFLCANYLVECINALCSHAMIHKASLRIKQLTKIRKLIAGHINLVPDYVPTLCQFYAPVQKIVKKKTTEKKQKKGRKRKLETSQSETSNLSVEVSQVPEASLEMDTSNQSEPIPEDADLRLYSGYFRELSWEAHKLLKPGVRLQQDSEEMEVDDESFEKSELQATEILFLLEDLINKSEQILKDSKRLHHLKTKATCHLLETISTTEFIEAVTTILPNILNKMEAFSKYSKDLLEANDYIYDAKGMYPPEASDIKLALAACLKLIADLVSWKGLQNPNNKLLLRDILIILSKKRVAENLSMPSIGSIAVEAAKYIAEFSKSILIFGGGFSIVKMYQACLNLASSKDLSALADLCYKLLSRNWYTITGTLEKGLTYNQNLDYLLKTYFSCVNNKLEAVQSTAKLAQSEVEELTGKDSTMTTFKSISKSNFPLLYRTLCEALVTASTEEFSKKKDDQHLLEVWSVVVEILLVLVEIAKVHSTRANLSSLLKRSQSIIQLFMSKGLPVAESALRLKTVEVLSVLKSLQTVTRFLHSICCHSKINNDSVLAAHAPAIRSLCDRLTLEVKGLLTYNNIPTDCIIIAVLKNRDLKGNDIISQETLEDCSDDESELPPEDTPQDEEE